MKKLSVFIMFIILSFSIFTSGVCAKRSGGSFRSSSRSSFSSSRSSKPSLNKPLSKPTLLTKRTTTSKTTNKSPAQMKAYEKAKTSGKAFTDKKKATTHFKNSAKTDPKVQVSMAKQYPTKYTSQPSTRPKHIPQTYQGQTVIYQNGGYGYMGGNGAFTMLATYMLIDTMSDAMLMSSMNNQGYHVGPRPVVHNNSFMGFIVCALIITFILVVILVITCYYGAKNEGW